MINERELIILFLVYLEPMEILLEERMKRVCNKWTQTGSCPFGENCRYSHRSNYDLMQLIEQQSSELYCFYSSLQLLS